MSKNLDSNIFWINFGDKSKFLKHLKPFLKHDTIDELGLGHIRGHYANLFFPGIITPMTWARYFLFIPAMYCFYTLQNCRVNRQIVENRQDELRDRIVQFYKRKGEKRQGIIGVSSEDELERWPDEIYWGGIYKIGILKENINRASYLQQIRCVEDGVRAHIGKYWNYDFNLFKNNYFSKNGNFKKDVSLELEKEEAEYLEEKLSHLDVPSLYPDLLKKHSEYREEYLWNISELKKNKKMWKHVQNAKYFSLFAQGLFLFYYHILSMKKAEIDEEHDKKNDFNILSGWYRCERVEMLNKWNYEDFIGEHKDTIEKKDGTVKFLQHMYKILKRNYTLETIIKNVKEIIEKREKDCKGETKARLWNKEKLEKWDGKTIKSYEYNWTNAKKIINDIIVGRKRR